MLAVIKKLVFMEVNQNFAPNFGIHRLGLGRDVYF